MPDGGFGTRSRSSGWIHASASAELDHRILSPPEDIGSKRGRSSQLGILVTTVSLEMLSDRHGFLDEMVEVLGEGRTEAYCLT